MRDKLGLSMIVNPEKTTARKMARVLRLPSAIKREQFCRQRFELIEYRITTDNPLVGMPLADLYHNIRVKILHPRLGGVLFLQPAAYAVANPV